MQKTSLLVLPLLLLAATTIAQNASVRGKINDENGLPLYLVLVQLSHSADSSIQQHTYTNEDGTFELRALAAGAYLLKGTYLGYEPHLQQITLAGTDTDQDLGSIGMKPSATLLNTVTVSGKQKFVERKIDRTVINVDALGGSSGSNALEVLERAPGVSIDQDGQIKLKGRSGVLVYIDEKPTYLSGAELENYLKSLPAGALKQIEIIPNPPAKYDAAGNSGIINILTKRNKLAGLHGNVSTVVQRGRYTRNNNNLNLNFNRKRVGVYLNLNGGLRESFQDLNINRYYKNQTDEVTSSFSQNSFIVKDGRSFNGNFGMDFYLSDKTTLGFSAKAGWSPNGAQTDNTAFVRDAAGAVLQKVNADNADERQLNNGTYNVYWKQQLGKKGGSIGVDADYVRYDSDAEQVFKNYIYTPNDVLTFQDQINGNLPSTIEIYAAKADYTQPLGEKAKFEAGVKTAFTATDNTADYRRTEGGITTPDYNLSNRFLYDEWIYAAYLNYSRSFGKVDLQLGLRGESTRLQGNQLGNPVQPDTNFTRQYNSLFPTIFALWRIDSSGKHVLSFNFGRRIDRPFFQDLNPFISPLDKFTFYGGNPNLLPTFSYNFNLTHTYRDWLNTTLSYGLVSDGINETLEISEGIYYSRPGNIATNHALSLALEATKAVRPWYTFMAYGEGGYLLYKSKLYTEILNTDGFYYYLSATNSFKLKKDWTLELRGDYQSDVISAQLLIKSYGTLNVAASKKILKQKGNLKLALNDLLYTRRADGIINNLQQTDADWNSRLDTRNVTLSFSYAFGKAINSKPKHNSSGSESEQRRVKT
jgi:hypothetical protein